MTTDGVELGRRLKRRRVSAGRTIASVATDAGLSVPYIANLENGRGNPTLAALAAIAQALGDRLEVRLGEADPDPTELPEALVAFARTPRFEREMARLAARTGEAELAVRERCLTAMAAIATAAGRSPSELDCQRLLDVIVLMSAD